MKNLPIFSENSDKIEGIDMEFIQLIAGIFLAVTILCRVQLEIPVPGWVILFAVCAEAAAFAVRYRISRQLDRLY